MKEVKLAVYGEPPSYNIGPWSAEDGPPPVLEVPAPKVLAIMCWDQDKDPRHGLDYYCRFGLKQGIYIQLGSEVAVLSPANAGQVAKALQDASRYVASVATTPPL